MCRALKAAVFAVLLLPAGCGGGGGSQSSAKCPTFARIAAGDFGRSDQLLWWTLEVVAIPGPLTFNRTGVPANVLEYRWAVDIDVDRNGEPDLRAAVTHYRQSGAAEVTTADILSVTQENLWTVKGPVSSSSGSLNATLTGNTFRFEVNAAEDPKLAQVTARAQSTWTTFHMPGANFTDQCEDSLK
ncbi:MAG TPA: hypothetical protein VFH73_29270 [Polyangia bacterium]|jgi:hypothetical protein|nr:hypothetical protein [Polyangia bacterium]